MREQSKKKAKNKKIRVSQIHLEVFFKSFTNGFRRQVQNRGFLTFNLLEG